MRDHRSPVIHIGVAAAQPGRCSNGEVGWNARRALEGYLRGYEDNVRSVG